MFSKGFCVRNVDESQLEHDLLLETTSAVLQSAAEAVGRVTSECDVWPERIQQLIST